MIKLAPKREEMDQHGRHFWAVFVTKKKHLSLSLSFSLSLSVNLNLNANVFNKVHGAKFKHFCYGYF
jgi:hypothetical protein